MAHKVWSDEANQWVEATDQRVQDLQSNMVKPGQSVPLPPVLPSEEIPFPPGVEEGDTLWMTFNERLNLDRAR